MQIFTGDKNMSMYQVMLELSLDEYSELKTDIKERGVMVPIEFDEFGNTLDGHNRLKICEELGITDYPKVIRAGMTEEQKRTHARKLNMARRQLSQEQRRDLIREQLKETPEKSDRQIAAALGVSNSTVSSQRKEMVANHQLCKSHSSIGADGRERPRQVTHKTVTIFNPTAAEEKAVKQPEIIERMAESGKSAVEVKREIKAEKQEEKRQENAEKIKELSTPLEAQGLFQTIVIDPPWDWSDEGDVNQFGRTKPDYATMPIEEIEKLPIDKISDENCHLYLWVTNRSLPKAFRLIKNWGFRYITCLTWVKPSIGVGNYFRGSTEQVLFAVKGCQPLKRKDVGTHFLANRGEVHSAKPDEFYSLVESCSYAPYIDVFGRKERDGWSVWGENG